MFGYNFFKFLNPGSWGFTKLKNSEFFVDKTGMLEKLNESIAKYCKYRCVSRPRGFGKTSDAQMIAAYYDRTAYSRNLFEGLDISKLESYGKYLNKYYVLYISVSDYYRSCGKNVSTKDIVSGLFKDITDELKSAFRDVFIFYDGSPSYVLDAIYRKHEVEFVIIIDDFDTLFFERKDDEEDLRAYLGALANLIKNDEYIALVYMTGILSLKNYFLSMDMDMDMDMFPETNMARCDLMADHMGFRYDKVELLCQKKGVSLSDLEKLCGGYTVDGNKLFCPYSVIQALSQKDNDPFSMLPEHGANEDLSHALEFSSEAVFDTINDILDGETVLGKLSYFKQGNRSFIYFESTFVFMVYFGYLTYDEGQLFVPNDAARARIENALKTLNRRRIGPPEKKD
ncbi:MAG: AAA family ATPase [Clostridia bacterium]|nr:AAA family ATPase [Clostridia bacterium]